MVVAQNWQRQELIQRAATPKKSSDHNICQHYVYHLLILMVPKKFQRNQVSKVAENLCGQDLLEKTAGLTDGLTDGQQDRQTQSP